MKCSIIRLPENKFPVIFFSNFLKPFSFLSRVDWAKRQASLDYNRNRTRILEDSPTAIDALRLAALLPASKVTSCKSRTAIPIRSQGTAFSNYTVSTVGQRAKSSRGTNRPATNLSARTDSSKVNTIIDNEHWETERKF